MPSRELQHGAMMSKLQSATEKLRLNLVTMLPLAGPPGSTGSIGPQGAFLPCCLRADLGRMISLLLLLLCACMGFELHFGR